MRMICLNEDLYDSKQFAEELASLKNILQIQIYHKNEELIHSVNDKKISSIKTYLIRVLAPVVLKQSLESVSENQMDDLVQVGCYSLSSLNESNLDKCDKVKEWMCKSLGFSKRSLDGGVVNMELIPFVPKISQILFPFLTQLRLNDCQIKSIERLCRLRASLLEFLHLDYNKITCIDSLAKIQTLQLKRLELGTNQIIQLAILSKNTQEYGQIHQTLILMFNLSNLSAESTKKHRNYFEQIAFVQAGLLKTKPNKK